MMFWRRENIEAKTADQLLAAIEENRAPVLVDVRSGKDFQNGHLPNSINIPLEEIERRKGELDSTKPTVFY